MRDQCHYLWGSTIVEPFNVIPITIYGFFVYLKPYIRALCSSCTQITIFYILLDYRACLDCYSTCTGID
ncbi:hypothetical protein BGW36DRAFT_377726, partial [Talaromyces proteolyticus]